MRNPHPRWRGSEGFDAAFTTRNVYNCATSSSPHASKTRQQFFWSKTSNAVELFTIVKGTIRHD